jgi:hypothetical protein
MRSARPATLLLVLALGLSAAGRAEALQTGTLTFTIEYLQLESGTLVPGDLPFGVGDTASASYSFDETVEATEGEEGLLDYSAALATLQVTLGSDFTVSFALPAALFIGFVGDDLTSGGGPGEPEQRTDAVSVNALSLLGPIGVGDLDVRSAVTLFARVADAPAVPELVTGGALPSGSFGELEIASIGLDLEDGSTVIVANTLVPEPGTGLLLALGLGALAQARRRFSV